MLTDAATSPGTAGVPPATERPVAVPGWPDGRLDGLAAGHGTSRTRRRGPPWRTRAREAEIEERSE